MYGDQSTLTGIAEDRAWHRFCGFLDLSLAGFMDVQRQRLMDALPALAASALGQGLIGSRLPRSVEEFRTTVRLTDYENYTPVFDSGRGAELPRQPVFWARTSRRNAEETNIPYTKEAFDQLMEACIAAFILASSDRPGGSKLRPRDRVLYNLPPLPFLSGKLAEGMEDRVSLQPVLDHRLADSMDFHDKVRAGFDSALDGGVQAVASMTSVLLKMGQSFESRQSKGGLRKVWKRPRTAYRLVRGVLTAKAKRRKLLPRDLWPVKALICWGIDTNVHRDALRRYWGAEPFEFLATTEGGIMAMQGWNKKGMTFLPHVNFLEFIPDDELARERRSPNLDPATHVMDELQPGHSYEVVITSLNGMPFVRYRTGELVEVIAADDAETGVILPQFSFVGRADRIIDIEGFTRLDESTLDRAVSAVAGGAIEWTARKELEGDSPILRVYAEGVEDVTAFGSALHESLVAEDAYYRDLQTMLEVQPLRVTGVASGTFRTFYENRRRKGYALDVRSMPRVNPNDEEIAELLDASTPVPIAAEAAA